jgi:hypothetical protein
MAPRHLRSLFLLIVLLFTVLLPARAQFKKGCAGINYIGSNASNPFTAEFVITSTMPVSSGEPRIIVRRESVARDSQGRIRFEQHAVAQPPDDRKTVTLVAPDGKPFTVTREEYGTLIDIFDCAAGRHVRIQPGMRIATVKDDTSATPPVPSKRSFPSLLIPSRSAPNFIVEDLGIRQIEDITVRGVRTKSIGIEMDGDWSGKPIDESETWVSDDLDVRMLWIHKDLKTGNEGRFELLSIKRDEPDLSLFEIPKDFEVNPARLPALKDSTLTRPSSQ